MFDVEELAGVEPTHESVPPSKNTEFRSLRFTFITDLLGQILLTLWAHKLRSFLTMFGIAWGVGSLLLLVGLGEGFRSGNKREMAEYGQDLIFLFPGRAPVIEGSMRSARNYLLTYDDYLDVRKAPYVR